MSQEHYAALLDNVARAGVYHLPARDVDTLYAAAREQGLKRFMVDLAGVRDKDAFLARMAQALSFPQWFGHNWDALEDCLNDMSWQEAEGFLVVLTGCDEFRAAAESDFAMALRILGATAENWREEDVAFWTLVELHADGIAWLPDLPQR